MKKTSWISTVIVQVVICISLYVFLNIGQPQKRVYESGKNYGKGVDIYFVSVVGGSRPAKEQALLLRQMDKVVKSYKAWFVVHISDVGKSDPFWQKATWYPALRKVPWYTTTALKGEGASHYHRKIKVPYGQTLDLIMVNTGLFQDSSNGAGTDELQWLTKTLNKSNSDWKIVAGFHRLVTDEDSPTETKEKHLSACLHTVFLDYGVNAYLSGPSCAIGGQDDGQLTAPVDKVPYFTPLNQNVVPNKGTVNGFLLHRVSHLEIVTYSVTSTGEVMQRSVLQQWGKEVM